MKHQCQCIFTVIRCNPYMVTQDNLWCIKRCPLTLCVLVLWIFFQFLLVIAMFSHLAGGPCPHPWDSPEKNKLKHWVMFLCVVCLRKMQYKYLEGGKMSQTVLWDPINFQFWYLKEITLKHLYEFLFCYISVMINIQFPKDTLRWRDKRVKITQSEHWAFLFYVDVWFFFQIFSPTHMGSFHCHVML